MVRLSSDHAKLLMAVSDLVSCIASPPSGLITKIWFLSSMRLLVKASHSPFGDQRGLVDDLSPRVSCSGLCCSPPVSTSQICVRNASCLKSALVTVYATYFPSGDICAPPI